MKKKLLALVLAGAMVASLAACGGQDTPNPTPGAEKTQEVQKTQAAEKTPEPTVDVTPGSAVGLTLTAPSYVSGNVADRLPVAEDIYVEQYTSTGVKLDIGKYVQGSELNLCGGTSSWTVGKPIMEALFKYTSSGDLQPNVAKSYEVNADSTVWTIHLREGMKWSNGDDFTSEDFVFWYEGCHLTNWTGKKDSWECWYTKNANGEKEYAEIKAVDKYTVQYTFKAPKYSFIQDVQIDCKVCWANKNVLSDLRTEKYGGPCTSDAEAIQKAQDKGLFNVGSDAKGMGKNLTYYFWNSAGVPTVNAWVLTTEDGFNDVKGITVKLVRNEYYWKVDAKGQQLPYIDVVKFHNYQADGQDQLEFRSGNLDILGVKTEMVSSILNDVNNDANANNDAKKYTSIGSSWGDVQMTFNYTCADAKYAELFNKIDFRHAMSICVDREEVAGVISGGWQEGGQACPQEGAQGYNETWAKLWTEYDVATAKTLLERCGLKKGTDGYYTFADGSELCINFASQTGNKADTNYGILKTYFEAVGIKTTFKDYDVTLFDKLVDDNEWMACLQPHSPLGGLSVLLKPIYFVPIAQAAEWYGEFGTYAQDNTKGVKPTGDMAKLYEIYTKIQSESDSAKRLEYANQIYKILQDNMWTIAFLEPTKGYTVVNSKIHNYADNAVGTDEYQDSNIYHYWTLFKD